MFAVMIPDLFEKDPARDGITRETIVLEDAIDALYVSIVDRKGERKQKLVFEQFIIDVNADLHRFTDTAESRFATHASKMCKAWIAEHRRHIALIELLDRRIQDERLAANRRWAATRGSH